MLSLREIAQSAGLPIGAAVDRSVLQRGDAHYRETLVREFNGVVAENAFKPSEVWIGPREYDFSVTDALADFAQTNGLLVRGYTLVWHQQTPRWLAEHEKTLTPGECRDLLRDYIHAIVGRYKGRIAHWDAVNEAVLDAPIDAPHPPGLRTGEGSVWERTLGPDYLQWAFEWVHEADPDARLYYNDYEIEAVCPKSDAIYNLVKGLLEKNVPIHGVGFQGHLLNGWRLTDSHIENTRRFTDLGLDWLITEADIRMELNGNPPTPEQLQTQATGYADLAHCCKTDPRCTGLFVWGFTDAHSWIPGFRKGWGAALPLDEQFDEQYEPKPAYNALCAALQNETFARADKRPRSHTCEPGS